MANTATVYARIDPKLKSDVDNILAQIGLTPSTLIQMLYCEIRNTKRVPLSLSLPSQLPLSVSEMNRAEFNNEIQKGIDDVSKEKTKSLDEMDAILRKDLGI